jgi:hypothetical protein
LPNKKRQKQGLFVFGSEKCSLKNSVVVVVALGSAIGVELSFLGLSTGVDVSTSFRRTS